MYLLILQVLNIQNVGVESKTSQANNGRVPSRIVQPERHPPRGRRPEAGPGDEKRRQTPRSGQFSLDEDI